MAQYFFNPADHATGALGSGIFDLAGLSDLTEFSIADDVSTDYGKVLRWTTGAVFGARFATIPALSGASGNYEVLMCFKLDGSVSADEGVGPTVRFTDTNNHTRVQQSLRTTNATIRQWVNPLSVKAGSFTGHGTAATVDWTTGDWLMMRYIVTVVPTGGDDDMRIRVTRWHKEDSEPAAQYDATVVSTPAIPVSSGSAGLYNESQAKTCDLQWFGIGTNGDAAPDAPLAPSNTAPVVEITLPVSGVEVIDGATVTFEATATDAESGDISARIVWTSDLDGQIGTGASFNTTSLSVGTHTITATVFDALSLEGSDQIYVTVTDAPTDSDLPAPEYAVLDPTGPDFFSVYIYSDPPAGVTQFRIRYTVDGEGTTTLPTIAIPNNDSGELWRVQTIEGLTLGATGYVEIQWVSDDGQGPWGDAVPFALGTEAAEEDSVDSLGEAGEIVAFTQSPELEWKWPSFRVETLLYQPGEIAANGGTGIRSFITVKRNGVTVATGGTYPYNPADETQFFDFMVPGAQFVIEYNVLYITTGYRATPVRTLVIDVPQALAPPRIIAPGKGDIEGGSAFLVEWEEEENGSLFPGTDRLEITYGDGVYTTLDEVDSELSSPVPMQSAVDPSSLQNGPFFLSVRRITPSDGTSVRRLAGPFIMDNLGYGGKVSADLAEYDIFGAESDEDDSWSETVDPESSEAVMQRFGTVGAGHLAVKSLAVGEAIDVIVVGKNASSDGTGNWLQYTPDMHAAWGSAAFVSAEHRFLASRLTGWFGPTGTSSGQAVGVNQFSQWDTGTRLGKGTGNLQINVHSGLADSSFIRTNPSVDHWVRNNRYGDSRFASMTRVELLGELLEGSKRYRIRSYLLGPDREGEEAALPEDDITQDAAEYSGAPGISTISNSALARIWIYSLTHYGGEAAPDDDLGTNPLPGWRIPGEFLIQLDPSIDWASLDIPGIIIAEDGSAWLDYAHLPVYE